MVKDLLWKKKIKNVMKNWLTVESPNLNNTTWTMTVREQLSKK